MCAGLEQRRQLVVGQVVIDVAQLVVDGGEVFFVGLDAHLGAHVAAHVHVPRAGVADHVAVHRLDELGLGPVALGQLGHAQAGVEVLGALGHLLGDLQLRFALGLEQLVRARARTCLGQRRLVVGLVLLFQRAGDVQAAGALVRLQHVPQVAPVLLPHVAHQVRRQQAVDLAFFNPVGGLQLGAGVAVQLLVQRLDLAPQAVGLGGDLGRRHVVAAAPHLAGVGEAHFLGALVHQLDEARVVLAHRLGDGVPALPRVQLRVVVAAAAQDVFQFAQLAALLGVALAGAVGAGTVGAFHPGGDLGEFGQLGRILRRRHRRGQLQQLDGARGLGRHLLAFELLGLLDPAVELGQVALVALGGQQLAVVVDVGAGQPLRGGHLRIHLLELVVDARDELVRGLALGRGRRGGRIGGRLVLLAGGKGDEARADGEGEQEMAMLHGTSFRVRWAQEAEG